MASPPDGPAPPRRLLPATANLEHLRKQAKLRLRELCAHAPESKLADAQLAVARDYGFASWRALKAAVDQIARSEESDHPCAGYYRLDPDVVSNSIIVVTQERAQLYAQENGRPKTPLTSVGSDTFGVTGSTVRYRFEGPSEQPAERVVIDMDGGSVVAVRTTPEDAKQAEADFARDLAEQARPRARVAISADMLEPYVGVYASPLGLVMEVTRRTSRLCARLAGQPEFEIHPEGPHRFFYVVVPAQISFRMRDGRAQALTLHQHGRVTHCSRTTSGAAAQIVEQIEQRRAEQERPRAHTSLSEDVLKLYVGRYDLSHDIGLAVTMEGDRLFGQVTGQRRFEMFAEGKESFFLTVAAVQITFIENATGRIDRAVIHQHGRETVMMRDFSEGEEV